MANGADFSFLKKLGIGGSDPTQGGTVGNPTAAIGQVGYINPGGAVSQSGRPSIGMGAKQAGRFDDIFNSQLASGLPDMLSEFGKRPETYASDATGQSGQPGMENFEALDPGGGWAGEYAPSGYKDLIADPSIEGYSPNYKKRKRYT